MDTVDLHFGCIQNICNCYLSMFLFMFLGTTQIQIDGISLLGYHQFRLRQYPTQPQTQSEVKRAHIQ